MSLLDRREVIIAAHPDWMSFTAIQPGSQVQVFYHGSLNNSGAPRVYASSDGKNWFELPKYGGTPAWFTFASVGERLFLRGEFERSTFSDRNYLSFTLAGEIAAAGNAMSLFGSRMNDTVAGEGWFYRMFKDQAALTKAPYFPALILSGATYAGTFSGCTGLTEAAEVAATAGYRSSMSDMYAGCTGLVKASKLRIRTIDYFGCNGMYKGCTSLTVIPKIDVVSIGYNGIGDIFNGCSNVKFSTTQTDEYPNQWSVNVSGSTESYWNYNSLTGTGGTFKGEIVKNRIYYTANEVI